MPAVWTQQAAMNAASSRPPDLLRSSVHHVKAAATRKSKWTCNTFIRYVLWNSEFIFGAAAVAAVVSRDV